jgi:hypothetical protein
MGPKRISQRQVRAVGAVLMSAVLPTGVAAAASKPTFKSGTYKGTLAAPRNFITVTLKLTGKKVSGLTISDVPLFCSGGGRPIPIHLSKATITTAGRFTSTGTYLFQVGPFKGQVGDQLTINGRFSTKGKLTGTLKVVLPRTPACNGTTTFTASKK